MDADKRLALLPPRALPLIYFSYARVAFFAAALVVALDPIGAAGFFYHARMLALVHLVTIGWLSCSILGSIYIVGPFALRIALPARRADYVASAVAGVALAGVVVAFWRNVPSAVGLWGSLFVPVILFVGGRTVRALREAPVQPAIKLHIALAFANMILAAVFGILIAFDKTFHFLPGALLSNVFAHAHLAAIGWVGMMSVGVGYRLFPMILPAAMPEGRSLFASAILLEAGTLLVAVGLAARAALVTTAAAIVATAGFAAFLLHVRGMLQKPRPAPAARPSPDYGVLQSMAALACLAISIALGLYLAITPMSETTLRVALAYGVFGLVGFFGQLVAGMEYRLLPYFAWYWTFANSGFKESPSPHGMPLGGLQQLSFWLWVVAVPLLAAGLAVTLPLLVATGAWALVAAIVVGGIDAFAIARHAFRVPKGTEDVNHRGH